MTEPRPYRFPVGQLLRLLTSAPCALFLGAVAAHSEGVPTSANLTPHFERAGARQVLFVEGRPHVILAAELPWWDIVWGRQDQTIHAYDQLYPAARTMELNALKVPIKWSQVEPQPGKFDFSYVDHAKGLAEKHGLKLVLCWFGHHASSDGTIYYNLAGDVFAPMDVIQDDKTYPRAVDADGRAHHNAASYEHDAIIDREIAAFRAFMEHIKRTDATTRTILMVQVENEIAVFGWDRRNRKLWRDHSPEANRAFAEHGFDDDLRYSAWRLSTRWIKPLTDAGAQVYPLPLYLNYADGKLADWMVGGSPGEDVATCLDVCPAVAFVGLNLYLPGDATLDDFRAKLTPYRVGRNIVATTETNSDATPVAPRLAYVAIGEYGAPLFAPWALTVSAPTLSQPYVQEDGRLGYGASALQDCYRSLSMALPEIATFASTEKLKVFMSHAPGEAFTQIEDVGGAKVEVKGWNNGQAIVISPAPNEFIVVGYRCEASIHGPQFEWPALQGVKVERGRSEGGKWVGKGEPYFGIDQSEKKLNLYLDPPQAIRVTCDDYLRTSVGRELAIPLFGGGSLSVAALRRQV